MRVVRTNNPAPAPPRAAASRVICRQGNFRQFLTPTYRRCFLLRRSRFAISKMYWLFILLPILSLWARWEKVVEYTVRAWPRGVCRAAGGPASAYRANRRNLVVTRSAWRPLLASCARSARRHWGVCEAVWWFGGWRPLGICPAGVAVAVPVGRGGPRVGPVGSA